MIDQLRHYIVSIAVEPWRTWRYCLLGSVVLLALILSRSGVSGRVSERILVYCYRCYSSVYVLYH